MKTKAILKGGARVALPEPDINITPLVDVVLVLLIIFMVITPALAEGDHLELPKVLNPDAKPRDMHPIDLAITATGRTLLERVAIPKETVVPRLRAMHDKDPKRSLLLKIDEKVPYQEARTMFATIQDLGFRGVSLKVVQREAPTTN